jgi:hypothetical protein
VCHGATHRGFTYLLSILVEIIDGHTTVALHVCLLEAPFEGLHVPHVQLCHVHDALEFMIISGIVDVKLALQAGQRIAHQILHQRHRTHDAHSLPSKIAKSLPYYCT